MPTFAGDADPIVTNMRGINVGVPVFGATVNQAAGFNLALITAGTQTVTLSQTTQVTSVVGVSGVRIETITVNQSGGAVTMDSAASLYIEAAPAAGASVTLTNSYALWVDAGLARLDGGVTFAGSGQSTLSNYTEGTFTPTVTAGADVIPVYSTNTGRYTRIGNTVFVDVFLTGDGGNEGIGATQINIALPITAGASHPTSHFPCGYALNSTTDYEIWGQVAGSATTIALSYFSAIQVRANFVSNDQGNTTRTIRLKFSYEV